MNRTPSHCVSYALKTLSLASYSPPVAFSLGRLYRYYYYTGQKFRLSESFNVAYLISKAKDPQRTLKGPSKDPQRTPKEHPYLKNGLDQGSLKGLGFGGRGLVTNKAAMETSDEGVSVK